MYEGWGDLCFGGVERNVHQAGMHDEVMKLPNFVVVLWRVSVISVRSCGCYFEMRRTLSSFGDKQGRTLLRAHPKIGGEGGGGVGPSSSEVHAFFGGITISGFDHVVLVSRRHFGHVVIILTVNPTRVHVPDRVRPYCTILSCALHRFLGSFLLVFSVRELCRQLLLHRGGKVDFVCPAV